ncbi:ATP-dependent DNA ligase [Mesorhizobium atlanticum]
MEPELVEQPPKGDGWSHEVKFDGYRTQLIKDEDGIRLRTKTGIDWTKKYRTIAKEAAALNADSFIIEGEMIVTSDAGFPISMRCARPSRGGHRTSHRWLLIFFTSMARTFATCRSASAGTCCRR